MDTTQHNDAEWLKRLQAGDEQAFAEIHSHLWKPLFYSAYRVIQDRAAAQDIVQEVFISLWEKRSFIDIRSFGAYLRGAVRLQVLNYIRHNKADERMLNRLKLASVNIIKNEPHLFRELGDIYARVLESLPKDHQEYFRLNREYGVTYEQIAQHRNISIKTVEKKISHTLKTLRLEFEKALFL